VTVHYTWTVNDAPVPGSDAPFLTPNNFQAGDVVGVSAVVTDDWGASSETVVANSKTVRWNIIATSSVRPGGTIGVNGAGFAPNEVVDLRLDSPSAETLATTTTDPEGKFDGLHVTFPSETPGGGRLLYGVGRTSGRAGPGPVTVTPRVDITPAILAAGDPTTLTGAGFVPGETVTASFPEGTSWQQAADAMGSVVMSLVSPELPAGGGVVTARAPSASASATYSVLPRFTSPDSGQPLQSVPVTVTGYGASEWITLWFDGAPSGRSFLADVNGSLHTDINLPSTFGAHTLTMTGSSSLISKTNPVNLPPWMIVTPTSGPVGTTVAVDSGPGWIPGSVVRLMWQTKVKQVLMANANGSVHTTFRIPTHKPGTVTMRLRSSDLGVTATAQFTVTRVTSQQTTYGPRRMS
jgi:large repetitive protein